MGTGQIESELQFQNSQLPVFCCSPFQVGFLCRFKVNTTCVYRSRVTQADPSVPAIIDFDLGVFHSCHQHLWWYICHQNLPMVKFF